jgi:hypothetical protein
LQHLVSKQAATLSFQTSSKFRKHKSNINVYAHTPQNNFKQIFKKKKNINWLEREQIL